MGEREPEHDPTYGSDLVQRSQALLAARTGTLEERTVALEYALSEALTALTGCLSRLHRLEANMAALLGLVARAPDAVEPPDEPDERPPSGRRSTDPPE